MNPQELYEKQYGEGKLEGDYTSFPFLRKLFKRYDVGREDVALKLLQGERGRILDVGCGEGLFLTKVRDQFQELYGIDVSKSRIKKAQELNAGSDKFKFSVADVNLGINFPNNFFDVVISLAVIEHIFDPFFVVGEINRVLKPEGIFILEVPNIAYFKYRIQLLFGKLPVTSSPYNWEEIGWDGGHLHCFTSASLRKLLVAKGFKVEKVSGSGLFAPLRNWFPSIFTGDICMKARKAQ